MSNVIPLWDIMADYYASDEYEGPNKGLTGDQIKADLNRGVIVPFADVEAAFRMTTSEGGRYYNVMGQMMQTSWGQEQVLGENLTNMSAFVVAPVQEIWNKGILPSLNDATGRIVNMMEQFSHFGDPSPDPLARRFWNALKTDPEIGKAIGAIETGAAIVHNANFLGTNLVTKPIVDFFSRGGYLLNWLGRDVRVTESGREFGGGGRRFDGSVSLIELLDMIRDSDPGAYDMGTPSNVETIFNDMFNDENTPFPATPGLSSLVVQLQNMPQQITAAVQEGMNGVTITANVTTGDVRLQDGTIVGALTPKINLLLGAMLASSSRG